MTVITITTDFGSGDHEAGVLKGVIWKINPEVNIVDLSHDICPHDTFEAGLLLFRTTPYFPAGTIHMVVVDPGVGTSRRGIVAHIGSQFYVGPDNGTVTMLLDRAVEQNERIEVVNLDIPKYWLSEVSSIFHGRDIFAPVSAHLTLGIDVNDFGTPIRDPVRLLIPTPQKVPSGWLGEVVHIDHFGNLATNLKKVQLDMAKEVQVKIKNITISQLSKTFGEQPTGSLIALLDSSNSLAISVVNGNAATALQAVVGDVVELELKF